MHTDSSLEEFRTVTKALGNCLRHFAEVTCTHYNTFETDREVTARKRADARKNPGTSSTQGSQRRPKQFSLATFKLHALGDYVDDIKRFGTTDSYTTRTVSHLA